MKIMNQIDKLEIRYDILNWSYWEHYKFEKDLRFSSPKDNIKIQKVLDEMNDIIKNRKIIQDEIDLIKKSASG